MHHMHTLTERNSGLLILTLCPVHQSPASKIVMFSVLMRDIPPILDNKTKDRNVL